MAKTESSITAEQVRELLHYDPETGIFTRKIRTSTSIKVGDIAGSKNGDGYIDISLRRISYKAHRLVWMYVYGAWPDGQIDHINGVRDDNRLINLRPATNQENGRNVAIRLDNKCGVVGVGWNKSRGKWQAYIGVDCEVITLGRFNDLFEAVAARKSAEILYGFHQNHGRRSNG